MPGSIAEWGWSSDYPDPDGLLSGFIGSRGHVVVPDEVTALVARARAVHDRDERLDLFRQADRILVSEETWLVPSAYDHFDLLHRPNVEGIWAHALGMAPLDEVIVRR